MRFTDVNGLLDEAKNEMTLGHNRTSHATYRHSTPDLENESDSEQRQAHATSDPHPAAQNHVLSVSFTLPNLSPFIRHYDVHPVHLFNVRQYIHIYIYISTINNARNVVLHAAHVQV